MELVESEDLSQLLVRGAVPLDQALSIARQMAEALEAAHERGIIHRDLKPANIKVREDGAVKVLDFGLAKALAPASGSSPSTPGAGLANSPTFTSPGHLGPGYDAGTQLGVILGTAAYRAPEQAKGRAVDRRADVWAFGVVLYEMLTGRRAFAGDDTTDILAAIVRDEPDWTALPADAPPGVHRLLRRCLRKDRAKRLDSMAAARIEIDEALEDPSPRPHAGRNARSLWRRGRVAAAIGGATAIAMAAALATVAIVRQPRPSGRFERGWSWERPSNRTPSSVRRSRYRRTAG